MQSATPYMLVYRKRTDITTIPEEPKQEDKEVMFCVKMYVLLTFCLEEDY
jgi:hypothetical protein